MYAKLCHGAASRADHQGGAAGNPVATRGRAGGLGARRWRNKRAPDRWVVRGGEQNKKEIAGPTRGYVNRGRGKGRCEAAVRPPRIPFALGAILAILAGGVARARCSRPNGRSFCILSHSISSTSPRGEIPGSPPSSGPVPVEVRVPGRICLSPILPTHALSSLFLYSSYYEVILSTCFCLSRFYPVHLPLFDVLVPELSLPSLFARYPRFALAEGWYDRGGNWSGK